MDFSNIETVLDLKECGELKDLVDALSKVVSPFRIEASSYEELLPYVLKLNEKWVDFIDSPFVSRKAELVFYLTKLEGKQRNKALGITDEHYENKETAKKWYRSLSQHVHSDKGGHDDAFKMLKRLYEVMTDDSMGDDDE